VGFLTGLEMARASPDPAPKGAPAGRALPVPEASASAGAGFAYPICGDIPTMPGLDSSPAASRIDLGADGQIVGLS
jgi:formate--tetrahydrofolate ligase